MRKTFLVVLGAAIVGLAIYVPLSNADETVALDSPTITFLVPQGTAIHPIDVVVYVGQPAGFTTLGGSCTRDNTSAFPIQSVVITAPAAGRAQRLSGLITASQTAPVPDGTRVGQLIGPISCVANGTNYDKWTGVVR